MSSRLTGEGVKLVLSQPIWSDYLPLAVHEYQGFVSKMGSKADFFPKMQNCDRSQLVFKFLQRNAVLI